MMKRDITSALVNEHRLILRMLELIGKKAPLAMAGADIDFGFYRDAVDFIRNYADRYHHAKEEDILFEALVENGMPRENSPVAAMLMEHDRGRAYVAALETATREAEAGVPGRGPLIAANALAYRELLLEHIAREDTILYPLAERVLPDEVRDGIVAGYREAEGRTPTGFVLHYEQLVARYEADAAPAAAA